MYEENPKIFGQESAIPESYRWKDLTILEGLDLTKLYEDTPQKLSEEENMIGTIFTKVQSKKPIRTDVWSNCSIARIIRKIARLEEKGERQRR